MSQIIEPTITEVLPALPPVNGVDAQQMESVLAEVAKSHQTVRDFSQRLFGGEVTIELQNDLEDGEPFFMVTGYAAGSAEALADLIWKWHEELCARVADHPRFYSLTLIPQK